eukprot:g37429.t1
MVKRQVLCQEAILNQMAEIALQLIVVSICELGRRKKMTFPCLIIYIVIVAAVFMGRHVRELLFRQLCALTWLLEAVTVEPLSTMGTVTTCWSA